MCARLTATEKHRIVCSPRHDATALLLKVRDEFQGFMNPMRPLIRLRRIDGEEWICIGTRFRISVTRDPMLWQHKCIEHTEHTNKTHVNTLNGLCAMIHYRYTSGSGTNHGILEYRTSVLKRMVEDKMITWAYLHRLNARRYSILTKDATKEFEKTQKRLRTALNDLANQKQRSK